MTHRMTVAKNYAFLSAQEWEPIVARRTLPLRSALVYGGFLEWYQQRYRHRLQYPFLAFFEINNGKVASHNFISRTAYDQIIVDLTAELRRDFKATVRMIRAFDPSGYALRKEIRRIVDSKLPLARQFEQFVRAWKQFTALSVPVLFWEQILVSMIEAIHPEISYQQLVQAVAVSVKSRFLDRTVKTLTPVRLFSDTKSIACLSLLRALSGSRESRKFYYAKAWNQDALHFFTALATATNLGDDVGWVMPEEIMRRLGKKRVYKPYPRQAILYWKNGMRIEYGEDFSQLKQSVMESMGAYSSVMGRSAYPGIVRGRVRLVGMHDTMPIEKGVILVTKMTTAQFIPFIRDCAGIVTDEGGITCHAAIISREFKKPCVIGTRHATRVFNNGDRVEVDANRGIVKKV